jgi:paraquat-inducible protein B
MSKRAKPTAIGAFVLGAVVIGIMLIVYFGSLKFFAKEQRYVLYFNNSVNGLNVGAPVKFKGVQVGKVEEIRIFSSGVDDLTHGAYIPVIISIDYTLLENHGIMHDLGNEVVLQKHIDAGFRGQLELESLISGQLFIELDYDKDSPANFVQATGDYLEIPTRKSTIDEAGEAASRVFADLRSVDIAYMYNEFMRLVENLNAKVEQLDIQGVQNHFVQATDSVTNLANSVDVKDILNQIEDVTTRASDLMQTLQGEVAPAKAKMSGLMDEIQKTVATLNEAGQTLNNSMAPDSALSIELQNNLRSLRQMLQSATQLLQYLERHPNGLLSGRPEETGVTSQ